MGKEETITAASAAEELVKSAIARLAEHLGEEALRANRIRAMHWSEDRLVAQYGEWARTLCERPVRTLQSAHLGGTRNRRETGLGHHGLRHMLPTGASLLLSQDAARDELGLVDFTLIKVFESQYENEAYQKPNQSGTLSPLLGPEEPGHGTRLGRYAHVLLLAVTESGLCVPVACAPLVKDVYQPRIQEEEARRLGTSRGLSGSAREQFVDDILERRRRESKEMSGREDLPCSEGEILHELSESVRLGEALTDQEGIFTGPPLLGGWLVGTSTLPSAVRAPLIGHSLSAMKGQRDLGRSFLFDLVAPSQVETLSLKDVPWTLTIKQTPNHGVAQERTLSGAELEDALDAEDEGIWQLVDPRLTPDETGDDYWFLARGELGMGSASEYGCLLAHVGVEDGLLVDQVRVSLEDLADDGSLERAVRWSFQEARVHSDGAVDRLRDAMFRHGALDVRPGKVIGENLTALALLVSSVKVVGERLGWP